MRASPLKVPPMPIPARAAVPRDLDGDDADGSCAAVVTVIVAKIGGDSVGDGDNGDEVEEEGNDGN